jgi:hypothetical protein
LNQQIRFCRSFDGTRLAYTPSTILTSRSAALPSALSAAW